MSGPTDEPPAVRPAVAWAFLVLVVVSFALPTFVRLPTTLFGPRTDEIVGSAALTALFAGLVLNGFWTGNMLSIFWGFRSKGRAWASRTDDPWMFWFFAVFYSLFALLGSYFLVRALLTV